MELVRVLAGGGALSDVFHEMATYQHQRLRRFGRDWVAPVTVIGGFLGAGKTTTVNHMLSCPETEKWDVLIREYGVFSIDDKLMKIPGDRVHVEAGIAMHVDEETVLYAALDRLHEERFEKFERLLLETSGTESPEQFVHVFFLWDMPSRYRLGNFITVIDAEYGNLDLDEYQNAREQVAFADIVLINKTDLSDENKLSSLEERIRSMNAMADIRRTTFGMISPDNVVETSLYDQLRKLRELPVSDGGYNDVIKSYVLDIKEPLDKAKVNLWINELFQTRGSKILRSKGFFNFAGEDYRYEFQAVRKTFHSYANQVWKADDDRRTVVVLIGEDLPQQGLLLASLRDCIA